jgi:hypothetical protein
MMEEIRKKYSTKTFFQRDVEEGDEVNSSSPTPFFEGYDYIVNLLLHPVADGRNRILWLIISPFVVNVLKMDEENAVKMIHEYMRKCNEILETDAINHIEYYVRRAKDIKLFPPKEETLKKNFPDLYSIIKKVCDEDAN